jgi:hypothetical protein
METTWGGGRHFRRVRKSSRAAVGGPDRFAIPSSIASIANSASIALAPRPPAIRARHGVVLICGCWRWFSLLDVPPFQMMFQSETSTNHIKTYVSIYYNHQTSLKCSYWNLSSLNG